jgi:hypothetical protein
MINFVFGAIVGGFVVYVNPTIVDTIMSIVKGVL